MSSIFEEMAVLGVVVGFLTATLICTLNFFISKYGWRYSLVTTGIIISICSILGLFMGLAVLFGLLVISEFMSITIPIHLEEPFMFSALLISMLLIAVICNLLSNRIHPYLDTLLNSLTTKLMEKSTKQRG